MRCFNNIPSVLCDVALDVLDCILVLLFILFFVSGTKELSVVIVNIFL